MSRSSAAPPHQRLPVRDLRRGRARAARRARGAGRHAARRPPARSTATRRHGPAFLSSVGRAARRSCSSTPWATSSWTARPPPPQVFAGVYRTSTEYRSGMQVFQRMQKFEAEARAEPPAAGPPDAARVHEVGRLPHLRCRGQPNIGKEIGFDQGFEHFAVLPREGLRAGRAQVRGWSADIHSAPWFVYLHFMDPHVPYVQQRALLSRAAGRRPDRAGLGRLRQRDPLPRRQRSSRCSRRWESARTRSIVFIADHGEEFGDHGGRHHDPQLYCELSARPSLRARARRRPAARALNVSQVDLLPSAARELLGAPRSPQDAGRACARAAETGRRCRRSASSSACGARPPSTCAASSAATRSTSSRTTTPASAAPKRELYDSRPRPGREGRHALVERDPGLADELDALPARPRASDPKWKSDVESLRGQPDSCASSGSSATAARARTARRTPSTRARRRRRFGGTDGPSHAAAQRIVLGPEGSARSARSSRAPDRCPAPTSSEHALDRPVFLPVVQPRPPRAEGSAWTPGRAGNDKASEIDGEVVRETIPRVRPSARRGGRAAGWRTFSSRRRCSRPSCASRAERRPRRLVRAGDRAPAARRPCRVAGADPGALPHRGREQAAAAGEAAPLRHALHPAARERDGRADQALLPSATLSLPTTLDREGLPRRPPPRLLAQRSGGLRARARDPRPPRPLRSRRRFAVLDFRLRLQGACCATSCARCAASTSGART